ncbi:hypothetical protein [Kiloniella sp.]|uniref:hypothetical protein n=1 Tax=Kiloniella sp. TaxID=1938587 RepID=UPI003A8D2B94
MRSYKKILLLVILTMTLSACGNAAKRKVVIVGSEPLQSAQDNPSNTEEKNAEPSRGDTADQPEELAALSYDATPLEPDVNDDPKQLLGIDTKALEALLGKPSLVRKENPAVIWQYNAESCVLDLVLYDSVTSYVEARDEQVRPMDNRKCLRRLLLSKQ